MRRLAWAGIAVAILLAGCTAGMPTPSEPTPTASPAPALRPDPAAPLPIVQLAQFSGVASLSAGSMCTGTLIDTGVPTGPAYLLTNGHCVGDIGRSAQTTTVAHPWFGTATFLLAEGNRQNTLVVDVVQIAYSTMRHTDTAILRLKPTLGKLQELGLRPVPITSKEPTEGTAVVNVGVPVQDTPYEQWMLRRGECTLNAQGTVIEHLWLWFGVWSNDCPGIIEGSGGSPLFTLGEDGSPAEIVAMINTTTTGSRVSDGGECFLGRPCELTPIGPRMFEDVSYAQSVAGLGGCFTPEGSFALGQACPLPVSSIWTETGGGAFRGGNLPDAAGRTPAVSLVGPTAGPARTVVTPLTDGTACLRPETYYAASPSAASQAGFEWEQVGESLPIELPEAEGHYLLCAVAGEDYAGAASVLFKVDRTAPILPATAEVEQVDDDTVVVRPHLNPPELSTFRFTWGDSKTVNCEDTANFQEFLIPLTLRTDDLPATYCLYGVDAAGNSTEVSRMEISASAPE